MNASVKIIIGVVVTSILTGIILIYLMGTFMNELGTQKPEGYQEKEGGFQDRQAMGNLIARKRPVICARNATAFTGQSIQAVDFLESITDADGADIKAQVKIQGEQVDDAGSIFCVKQPGIYFITYSVSDSYGLTAKRRITILVNEMTGGDTT